MFPYFRILVFELQHSFSSLVLSTLETVYFSFLTSFENNVIIVTNILLWFKSRKWNFIII